MRQPRASALDTLPGLIANRKVFKAIAAASRPGTLADMNLAAGYPPTDPNKDMGFTDPPNGAVAPAYNVNIQNIKTHRGIRYLAKVVKTTNAFEGNVDSIYVPPSTYYTHYRWQPDTSLLEDNLPANTPAHNRLSTPQARASAVNWDHVYVNVSKQVSNLSKGAENEHLSDIRHAYQISLGGLDSAINSVIREMPKGGYGPLTSKGYASPEGAANDVWNKIHNKLPVVAQNNLSKDQNSWLPKYQQLAGMTQHRDQQNWHYFSLRPSGFWLNNRLLKAVTELWDIYAEHPETAIQYLDVVPGPAMSIGVTPSNVVIHY
jgi:hypothetical protein